MLATSVAEENVEPIMHRYVSVVVPLVVMLHATTTSAKLNVTDCERMTGLTEKSAHNILTTITLNTNVTEIFAAICFGGCLKAIEPNPLIHENGTVNINVAKDRLEKLKSRTNDTSQVDDKIRIRGIEALIECAPEARGHFCDAALNVMSCIVSQVFPEYTRNITNLVISERAPSTVTESIHGP